MIELPSEYRPFFYLASALLGAEFVFLVAVVSSSQSGGLLTAAVVMLAVSMPCSLAACAACLTGDLDAAKQMLYGAAATAAAWVILIFLHLSILAGFFFIVFLAFGYRWLFMRHMKTKRAKQAEVA